MICFLMASFLILLPIVVTTSCRLFNVESHYAWRYSKYAISVFVMLEIDFGIVFSPFSLIS